MKTSDLLRAASPNYEHGEMNAIEALADVINKPSWYVANLFAYECIRRARREGGHSNLFPRAIALAEKVKD